MELLLALAIIIVVAEIKDWKQVQRNNALKHELAQIHTAHQMLCTQMGKGLKALSENEKTVDVNAMKVDSLLERLDDLRQIVEKAEANSATVLREYELNGVPLGYQRKPQNTEVIEGL